MSALAPISVRLNAGPRRPPPPMRACRLQMRACLPLTRACRLWMLVFRNGRLVRVLALLGWLDKPDVRGSRARARVLRGNRQQQVLRLERAAQAKRRRAL